MKFVKKSISLPKDLYEFAEKKAAATAKQSGSGDPPNISGWIRGLILKARQSQNQKKTA